MAFTIDKESLQMMSIFEGMTHAQVKDCFVDDAQTLTFVVQPGNLFKALGKGAANIRRLEKRFKRKIRVIEYAPELEDFVASVVYPNRCDIKVKGDIVTLVPHDLKMRGNLIGRAASHLRNTEKIVQRYFPVRRMVVTQVKEYI
ncbi:MAG: NusA-like transcription termination signal-binding factor [Nanoarchaeota archaeon]